MISRIHQKLGTAGFIISIVALVAALGGGAYAASGGLTSKQKKEVEKIAKKYAGKPGATGPQGTAGGAGAKGDAGGNGAPGGNGKSVVIGNATAGECSAGGKTVEVEGSGSKSKVCNGLTGFASELPSGQTETGSWAFGGITEEQEKGFYSLDVPVSFPFTLPTGEYPVTFIPEGGSSTAQCPGSPAEPLAEPGTVCVYETSGEGATFTSARNPEVEGIPKAGKTGVVLFFTNLESFGFGYGTWAVTAAE